MVTRVVLLATLALAGLTGLDALGLSMASRVEGRTNANERPATAPRIGGHASAAVSVGVAADASAAEQQLPALYDVPAVEPPSNPFTRIVQGIRRLLKGEISESKLAASLESAYDQHATDRLEAYAHQTTGLSDEQVVGKAKRIIFEMAESKYRPKAGRARVRTWTEEAIYLGYDPRLFVALAVLSEYYAQDPSRAAEEGGPGSSGFAPGEMARVYREIADDLGGARTALEDDDLPLSVHLLGQCEVFVSGCEVAFRSYIRDHVRGRSAGDRLRAVADLDARQLAQGIIETIDSFAPSSWKKAFESRVTLEGFDALGLGTAPDTGPGTDQKGQGWAAATREFYDEHTQYDKQRADWLAIYSSDGRSIVPALAVMLETFRLDPRKALDAFGSIEKAHGRGNRIVDDILLRTTDATGRVDEDQVRLLFEKMFASDYHSYFGSRLGYLRD